MMRCHMYDGDIKVYEDEECEEWREWVAEEECEEDAAFAT